MVVFNWSLLATTTDGAVCVDARRRTCHELFAPRSTGSVRAGHRQVLDAREIREERGRRRTFGAPVLGFSQELTFFF